MMKTENPLPANNNPLKPVALIGFILLLVLSFHTQSKVLTVKVGVFSDQLSLLEDLTREQDCPAVSLEHIGENQMLLEYLFICNLLKTDATTVDFVLEGYPVVPRLLAAIAAGDVDISGFGIWKKESMTAGVLRSQPLLKSYEFSKGLYVTEKTRQTLQNKSGDFFKSLIAVSNHNWTYDWQLLNCEFEQVLHIDRYEQMFQMLARERADILPLAFGKNRQMTRREFGTTLYPIEGFKLAFPDSTHILIAPKSPYNTWLQQRISARLRDINTRQQLSQWYTDIGVIKPQLKNWRRLCHD